MRAHNKKKKGFTLMELMVVLAIIGILASVAIPMLLQYIKKSKVSEVSLNIRKIYDGELSYYAEDHVSTTGEIIHKFVAAGPTPSNVPAATKAPGDWSTEGWKSINFAMDTYSAYQYQVVTTGTGNTAAFTARARGDLDGDGTYSVFERWGWVEQGGGGFGSTGIISNNPYE